MYIFYAKNTKKQTFFMILQTNNVVIISEVSVGHVAGNTTQHKSQSFLFQLESIDNKVDWELCFFCAWNKLHKMYVSYENICRHRWIVGGENAFPVKALKLKKKVHTFFCWCAIVLRKKDFILPILPSNKSFYYFFYYERKWKSFSRAIEKGGLEYQLGNKCDGIIFFVSSFGTLCMLDKNYKKHIFIDVT